MSDAPPSDIGSGDAVDQTIQRESDRFALPDLSFDPEADAPAPPLTAGSSIDVAAVGAFDSLSPNEFMTSLGEAFARATSTHPTDEDAEVSEDRTTS
ncbi:MAG: hypothetical protein HIU84_13880 [Acidobacteria bacterium]|nr:hypothetical protein [Acidobacteriota bacterium]